MQICFLSTSKVDETKIIGCATMVFKILHMAGRISITHTNFRTNADGNDKEKLVVKLAENAKHKWLHLIGDRLTHICLKSFVDTIHHSLCLFEDNCAMRSIMSATLERVVLGVGDLYSGGFSILNSTYTLFSR